MQYLLENRDWTPEKRSPYMKTLNRKQASTIFRARTRMLDIKHNYRGKYDNTTCRMCGNEEETQDHILEKCNTIHTNEITKVTKNEIFQEDPLKLVETYKKIEHIMMELNQP